MRNKNKKGFTLVEIMIVVVIIGLLAAIAVPAFNKVRENARVKSTQNNLRQIASAAQQYILDERKQQVSYFDLYPTYFSDIQSVSDEDYTALIVEEDSISISVFMDDLYVIHTM